MDEVKKEVVKDVIKAGVTSREETAEEKKMFESLARINGFKEYLMETMAKDMKRYFDAPKETQDLMKGHYTFADYLYKRLLKAS